MERKLTDPILAVDKNAWTSRTCVRNYVKWLFRWNRLEETCFFFYSADNSFYGAHTERWNGIECTSSYQVTMLVK